MNALNLLCVAFYICIEIMHRRIREMSVKISVVQEKQRGSDSYSSLLCVGIFSCLFGVLFFPFYLRGGNWI